MRNQSEIDEAELQGQAGFKEKMLARIIDNLQVDIRRVYFRFVD